MLTHAELSALQHELADSNVLTAYLDTGFTDPAMRDAWKPALQTVLRDARRLLVSASLDHDATDTEISAAASHAATELRATQGVELVDQLIEQAGRHARAAVGVPATQRALRANAVDLLLVTPKFIGSNEREVEDLVRATLASGADVEVPSGRAAEQLDQAAGGIAARLRFAIDEPPARGDTARS